MKDKIKSTEINVNKENIIPIADVKQESQCVLTLELYKDNVAFDITGQTVKLGAKTADGNVQLQESGFTINKNILTVDLKNSINSVVGLLEIDLTFTDSTGIMTTSSFYLNVIKKTLGKDNIIASNQLEAVKVLIEDLKTKGNNTIADIKKDYDSLKKVIIDNNAAANLQVQINGNKQQLVENTTRIEQLEDLQVQINENKQQLVENTTRIEQLEDLTPVWQEHEGRGNITVNDSFDGSTKDLTIKGRTLFNTVTSKNGQGAFGFDSELKAWANKAGKLSGGLLCKNVNLKPNTTYTIIYNVLKNLDDSPLSLDSYSSYVAKDNIDIPRKEGIQKKAFSTKETFDGIIEGFVLKITTWNKATTIEAGSLVIDDKIIILEGDWTNEEVFREYFDSITSVGELEDNKIKIKSVGKNLFNKHSNELSLGIGYSGTQNIGTSQNSEWAITEFIQVKPNTTYYKSGNAGGSAVHFFDKNKGWLNINGVSVVNGAFTTPSNCHYIRTNTRVSSLDNLLIEEDTKATNYEQYRAKLIEIPLPFAKGLKSTLDGTVYDEINISKGEIIQRVSEEYTELPKENIYKIPKDYLRFFNGTTNILQENNITSILKFEYPLNKDASIVSGLLINDILESEVTTNTNSINNLKTELAKHNIQTNPLWEGASFLADGQELTLNKSLDNCRNGVVLVWSQYNTSTNAATNERFAFVFIRKNTIVQNVNKPFSCLIANAGDRVSSYDHIITKYVSVSGTRVVGWRGNNQYQNAQSVLRAVYEW